MRNLTIGQLAKKAQLNVETARYYERRGLIPERAKGRRASERSKVVISSAQGQFERRTLHGYYFLGSQHTFCTPSAGHNGTLCG